MPPVTAERSPPDSRITGADSPVMADSSTDATPSITSPSPGIRSPGVQTTMSPDRSWLAATAMNCSGCARLASRLAWVSRRLLRRLSACALPRPSAIASAKLANSTVNQSQSAICSVKPIWPCPPAMSPARMTVVKTLPISTTNITGFRTMWRGSSLTTASRSARRTIGGSNSGRLVAGIRTPVLSASSGARRSGRATVPGRTSGRRR